MELEAPDGNGYWTVAKMLKNYLTLQQRVNIADIEQSKLLRKPLNVQTGQEDGHQGGRRYLPAERGYQIIRRWISTGAKLRLDTPRVASIRIAPENPVIQMPGARQQFQVIAAYADGTERARELLSEFGATVDFLS